MYKLSPIVLFSFIILYNRIKNCMYKEGSVPMKTKLTYFGHACFMLTRGDVSMIFDPFLTGNTWDIAKREDIKCQYIFVSHGHDDHYGDTDFIAIYIKSLPTRSSMNNRIGYNSSNLRIL